MAVIRKLWNGEYSLPVAFWAFYVGGALLSLIVVAPVLLASYQFDVSVLSVVVVLRLALLIVTSVGVWRSAQRNIASPIWISRIWGIAARAWVAFWAVGFVWINIVGAIDAFSN